MPEEKTALPEPKATEAPAKSAREALEDSLISKSTDKATEEPESSASPENTESPENADEVEALAQDVVPGETEKGDEEPVDEVDEILAEPEEGTEEGTKSNVQRRIDKLTAELKATRAEAEKLRAEKEPPQEKSKVPQYTDAQLQGALQKAWDEGDSKLAWEIISYKTEKAKQELIDMYQSEQNKVTEHQKNINQEWNQVVTAYDKYADTKIAPIYPGSSKDLNLRDGTSLLYQVAMKLYWNEDNDYYRKNPAGQKLAVADALTAILSKKGGNASSSKTKLLEKRLLKEKRKKSIPGSGSVGKEESSPKKPLSDSERLSEVIEERKKFQTDRGK